MVYLVKLSENYRVLDLSETMGNLSHCYMLLGKLTRNPLTFLLLRALKILLLL